MQQFPTAPAQQAQPQNMQQIAQPQTAAVGTSVLAAAALPVEMQVGSDAGGLAVSTGGFPNKLSIKGKQFSFFVDKQPVSQFALGQPFQCMILAYDPPGKHFSKAYYTASYQEGVDSIPDCSSGDGVVPDTGVATPQCDNCARCPLNAFGSGTDQQGMPSKGKACTDIKTLFVVSPDQVAQGHVFALRVPPSSFKNMSAMANEFARYNFPIYGAIVEIGFDNAVHPQLTFKIIQALDAAAIGVAQARSQSPEITDYINEPSTAPVVAKPQPAQAQLAAPVSINHMQAEVPQPAQIMAETPTPPQPLSQTPQTVTDVNGQVVAYGAMIDNGWSDDLMLAHNYTFNF